MKYLKIKNDGLLDVNGLSLMGASTKRGDDGKIGFFGTGNKYALACFLRNEIAVRIFTGTDEIEISTRDVSISNDVFSAIYINGAATSITTSMGPQWVVWQAIREIYSNALDCPGGGFSITDEVKPSDGETHFYIELTGEVAAISNNFEGYFSAGRNVISESAGCKIIEGGSGAVYRKGIRCIPMGGKTAFDYDLNSVSLNEMRLSDSNWQLSESIWSGILSSDNAAVVGKALSVSNNENYLESALISGLTDFTSSISEAAKQVLGTTLVATDGMRQLMSEYELDNAVFINERLFNHLIKMVGTENMIMPKSISVYGDIKFTTVDLSASDSFILKSAMRKINDSGIKVDYPMIVARIASSQNLAFADPVRQRIVLSERLFSMGETIIISAILEEWVHLKHDVKDCTRPMQDSIFNEFSSLIVRMATFSNMEAA